MARWSLPRRHPRLSGSPPSPNGASSLHLWWQLPPGPLVEVSAVVTVETAPAVDALYFWALQVGFETPGRALGAAHTGLQWHPGAPGGAVNWGGYGPAGAELEGTVSELVPVDSANTVHWTWQPGRPYRFRVAASAPQRWASEVTDLVDGRRAKLRDLTVAATGLTAPVVWTEMFARCDDPGVAARWSQLEGRRADGSVVVPSALTTSYQSHPDGGCANTESRLDGGAGVVQVTGLDGPRAGHHGQELAYRADNDERS